MNFNAGPAELLWKVGGELNSDSKWGAENTFFSVTLSNFQKSGGAEPPCPSPSAGPVTGKKVTQDWDADIVPPPYYLTIATLSS